MSMLAAATHDLPNGANVIVTPETLESCARGAERAGDHKMAAWLRALAENQRRLEGIAAERRYRLHYRRDRRGRVQRCAPYVPRFRRVLQRSTSRTATPRRRVAKKRVANATTGPPASPPAPEIRIVRTPGTAADLDQLVDALARFALAAAREPNGGTACGT